MKIRFKVWTSIGISEDIQRYTVYEMFPNGLVRIYRYEGTSRKSVDKQVKHIEKKEVQKLSSALRKELNVPVFARENSCPEKRFDLQISYTDGRKVNVTSTDEGAICFLRLLDKVVKKVKMS